MLVDYHIHALAHGEYKYENEWINCFLDHAFSKGIQELGFSEHDEYAPLVNVDLLAAIKAKSSGKIHIKLGMEVDYIPGREILIENMIKQKEYDYIIGSVHFIDTWGFDHPDYKEGFETRDIDEIYKRYTELLMEMIQSGYFDIVGHLDLVKIWGHKPKKHTTLDYMEPVLALIRSSGMTVEINSAGLRKPVAELYPSAELVKALFEKNIPITFGSDAHLPNQVGEGLKEAYMSAKQAGFKYLTRFDRHRKIVTPMEF